jgi:NAD(P)-dependent dehydrogenase (short-subunit alcohol dehydrogenase family)
MRILVTGATSGIGLATATQLAAGRHHVLLAGKDAESVERAAAAIRGRHPAARVEPFVADLAHLDEVANLAGDVMAAQPRLDALVLAAAVMNPVLASSNGIDTTLAVNHLAPVQLVRLLEPNLVGGRIVLIGSSQHGAAGPFDPTVFEVESGVGPVRRYEATKLLNLLYLRARAARNREVPMEAIDPGFVRTALGRRARGAMRVLLTLTRPIQVKADVPAALVTARLHSEAFVDGAYRASRGPGNLAANARDEEAAERAWDWTESQL